MSLSESTVAAVSTWRELDQALDVSGAASPPQPLPQQPRLGVLGGTFDPIHIGHLLLAQEAAKIMQLDRVYFVPAGQPPHKPGQPITPTRHRITMARLATESNPLFGVSELDAAEDTPSYTVELMQRMQARLPLQTDIYFLMGLDSLHDLPKWHNPSWLLENCNLVAMFRPDVRIDWPELQKALPNIQEKVKVLEMPGLDVSGLNVRARFMDGQPVRYLLTPEVIAYIRKHHLYKNGEGP